VFQEFEAKRYMNDSVAIAGGFICKFGVKLELQFVMNAMFTTIRHCVLSKTISIKPLPKDNPD
jgi:hypothetical protein